MRDKSGNNLKEWEDWIVFMLKGIEETANETTALVRGISSLMTEYKAILKPEFGNTYRHELLNNLFFHPYTKIEFIRKDMSIQRKTASKYLDRIVELGLLKKVKLGRENYYINTKLYELFLNRPNNNPAQALTIITE